MRLCKCGFCKVLVCVCVDFVKRGCVYVWIFKVCVCVCGFCKLWACECVDFFKDFVCVCVDFVKCVCVCFGNMVLVFTVFLHCFVYVYYLFFLYYCKG